VASGKKKLLSGVSLISGLVSVGDKFVDGIDLGNVSEIFYTFRYTT
jgi:hypothetical protein